VTGNGFADIAHRMLDRLTAMKLRVGSLRLRLGTIAPAEVGTHLIQIEKDIDATATLAQGVHVQAAEGTGSR
jgi:hypothetical protein